MFWSINRYIWEPVWYELLSIIGSRYIKLSIQQYYFCLESWIHQLYPVYGDFKKSLKYGISCLLYQYLQFWLLYKPKRLYTFLTVVQTKPLFTVLTHTNKTYIYYWLSNQMAGFAVNDQTKSNGIFLIHFLHGIICMHLIVVEVIVQTCPNFSMKQFHSSFILLFFCIGTFRPLCILQQLRSHHGSSISN